MIINLKQINLSDSDNIKLDKINYNFDQLVANGGGPMGNTGPVGAQGATGITGAQGYQGPIGPEGIEGPAGLNTTAYWKNIAGGGNVPVDTILPIHDNTSNLHPPMVSVGFMEGDSEYQNGQSTSPGQTPYQWIINRKTNFAHNLRFTSSDVLNNSFNFRMENDTLNSINKFTMGFQNINNTSIIWHAQNHIFTDNTTGLPLVEMGTSGITYHKDVEFDRPVTINGQLKITDPNAATDKIAVAADNTGTVTFKSIDQLGGTVPYGTIVSILPSVFNNNSNFKTTEVISLTPATNDFPLKISIGRGINDYAGWYICNGKTWTSESTQDSHIVPDLNSFSYSIPDNPTSIAVTSQGDAGETNDDTNIIGGANIGMNVQTPAPGFFVTQGTIDTGDTTISTATGTTFKIKKLPQIIYLGDDDCYWQDAGAGQAPITTNTYYIDDDNNGPTGSLTASTVRTLQQGITDQFTIRVYAASGYYFSTLPGGGAFTSGGQGYAVNYVSAQSAQYPTFVDVSITATQGVNNTTRTITWNSSTMVTQIPSYSVNFTRSLTPTNLTSITTNGAIPSSTVVSGNSIDGFDLTIVVTAGNISTKIFRFDNVNSIGIALAGSPPPGASVTVVSSTFTGISTPTLGWNDQITLQVKITGVPYGTSNISYNITGGPGTYKQIGNVHLLSGYQEKYPLESWNDNTPNMKIVNLDPATQYIRLAGDNNSGTTNTVGGYINGGTVGQVIINGTGTVLGMSTAIAINTYNNNPSNIKYGEVVWVSGTGYGFLAEWTICSNNRQAASCNLLY